MDAALVLTPALPALLPLGALTVALVGWVARLPRLTVGVLALSLVVGQVVRLPLPGQGGGLLVSDIAAVLVVIHALGRVLLTRTVRPVPAVALALVLPFVVWSAWTLTLRVPELGAVHALLAGAYWVRTSVYLLLLPALLVLLQRPALRRAAERYFIAAIAGLVLVGLLQLWLLPNLVGLPTVVRQLADGGGWDPHEGRLVSTWLDPNFFGGFLIMVLPWLATLPARGRRQRAGQILLIAAVSAALALTRSRGSLLALVSVGVLFTPLALVQWLAQVRLARVVLAGALAGMVVFALVVSVGLLGARAGGLLVYDDSIGARLAALPLVWQLAEQHTLWGVGYNAYQFAAEQAGLIGDFRIHSRAGADSSVLTLWVTTGVVGVLLFALPWTVAGVVSISTAIGRASAPALGLAVGLAAWGVHAQFVNSGLYAHLLLTAVLLTAITWQRWVSASSSLPG